jgi:hypothetical protein
VIAWLHRGDSGTDRIHDTRAFMAEDDRQWCREKLVPHHHVRVANACGDHTDAHFCRSRRLEQDILNL